MLYARKTEINHMSAWIFIVVFLFFWFAGCTWKQENSGEGDIPVQKIQAEPQVLHYWDEVFADTATASDPQRSLNMIPEFISALASLPEGTQKQAIARMLSAARRHKASFDRFFAGLEHYLYDPNSPVRNDMYYETALAYMLDSVELSPEDRIRKTARMELVGKNQVGDPARDFEFELSGGNTSALYDVQAPHLLLLFYDPGCAHCEDALRKLKNSSAFQRLLDSGQLQILAVYPFGNVEAWKKYQPEIPSDWMNAIDRDTQIIGNNLYDLKATPTIYLLNQDKQVLLKDSDLTQVVLYLSMKSQD